jgi:hypothetical protein
MKTRGLFYFLLTGIALQFACGKDDAPAGPSKTELITKAAWKYDTGGVDANKDGFADTALPPGYVLSCNTDNTLTFNTNNTGVVDEGATKCDPADPQTRDFTWTFTNNETRINFPTLVFNGLTGDVTIKTLTDTKLELIKEVNIGAPSTVNVIISFKH